MTAKLPPFPEELFEFYPNMSAQAHQQQVEEYAREAVKAALGASAARPGRKLTEEEAERADMHSDLRRASRDD